MECEIEFTDVKLSLQHYRWEIEFTDHMYTSTNQQTHSESVIRFRV